VMVWAALKQSGMDQERNKKERKKRKEKGREKWAGLRTLGPRRFLKILKAFLFPVLIQIQI
jgi:hypothetical protein